MDLPGPITVFAPVSSAFDLMAEGHLAYLSTAQVRTKEPFSAVTVNYDRCVSSSGSHQTAGAAQEPHRPIGSGQFTSRSNICNIWGTSDGPWPLIVPLTCVLFCFEVGGVQHRVHSQSGHAGQSGCDDQREPKCKCDVDGCAVTRVSVFELPSASGPDLHRWSCRVGSFSRS